ncbi:MAG: hypothetical protein PUP91_17895 [Rhizonema sp. PD37]|nr:hypothetical protein [Rhizonema sp. PD37]
MEAWQNLMQKHLDDEQCNVGKSTNTNSQETELTEEELLQVQGGLNLGNVVTFLG